MKDYFVELLERLDEKGYDIIWKKISINFQKRNNVFLGYYLSDEVNYIYNNYDSFELNWEGKGHKGFVQFIPYKCVDKEHMKLVETMKGCYDIQQDCLEIKEDIEHWYPLFKFPNGDSFCLDIRNGKVVFYEHEIYDSGLNLHGLVIALSINDLFEKWSKCLFVDIYDWYEGVNEEGIDVNLNIYSDVLGIRR